jgi:DNA-binding GntR family transcriptional regulator
MKRVFPSEAVPIPKTLGQLIYNYVREAIIKNKLKANQKINEKEIAEHFEVSTTPVREAVLRLGAEGFVKINSHREAVVKELSFQELKEILQVLSILDSSAAELVIENLTPQDLEELEDLTEKMARHCQPDSVDKFIELNTAIHNRLWRNLPNAFLRDTLHYAHNQLLRYNYARLAAFRKPGALEKSLEEHQHMLKVLKAKDKRAIRASVAKHWGSLFQPSTFEEGLKESIQTKGGEKRVNEKETAEGFIKENSEREGG